MSYSPNLLFYYPEWLKKNQAPLRGDSTGSFLGDLGRKSEKKNEPEYAKLRPKPDFLKKFEFEQQNKQQYDNKLLYGFNLKLKLENRNNKLQLILATFLLHLESKGKKHLMKDCLFDKISGNIQFLSEECLNEFKVLHSHVQKPKKYPRK